MVSAATQSPKALHADEPDISGIVIEDDTPVDNIFSEKQARLLTEPLYTSWSGPPLTEEGASRRFAALANVGLFSSPTEAPLVPDMMLSVDVSIESDLSDRRDRTYFIWRFGKPPEVVIEVVSNREGGELSTRYRGYRRMRVSYYVVYDPHGELGNVVLRTYELRGDLYVAVEQPWFESVGLGLVMWEGAFEGATACWLRWCTRDGTLIPTGAERAASEKARAEAEKARAEAEKARAEAEKVRAEAEKARAEAETVRAEAEKARAETETVRAEAEKARAESEKARAENAQARADTADARAQRLAAKLRALGIDPNGDG